MRKIKPISKIQALQIDTAELVPNCYIPGTINDPVDVVGTALAAKVTLTRNAYTGMPDGSYRITVDTVGAVGTGKYTVTDLVRGTVTQAITTSASAIAGVIPGIDIIVADTATTTIGDYCEFFVEGDQTYIIPGTILGRIKTGTNAGKFKPATDATIDDFDCFRVAQTFQETDKTKTVLPHGYEVNISSVYTIDVIVYGEVYEASCNAINLTANLKAKMPFIAWV